MSRSSIVVLAFIIGLMGSILLSLEAGLFESYLMEPQTDPDTIDLIPDASEIDYQVNTTTQKVPEGWPNLFGPTFNSTAHNVSAPLTWEGESPRVVWQKEIGIGYSSPVLSEGKVLIFSRKQEEEVLDAFDEKTGELLWSHAEPCTYECPFPPHSSGPYSTPIVHQGKVWTQGAEGRFQCLELETGKLLWSRDLKTEYDIPDPVFAVGHTPRLWNQQLLLNMGGAKAETGIVSLQPETGEKLWSCTKDAAAYSTPAIATIHNQTYGFVLTGDGLVALDPENGKVFWQFPFRANIDDAESATMPLVHGDLVVVSVYQAGTACLRILPDHSYEEVWRQKRTLVSQFNPLIAIEGYLYGWHFSDRSFRCVELTTGKVQWKYNSGLGRGTHIQIGNRFLLYGENGGLGMITARPDELEILKPSTQPLLEEPAFSAPAYHNGHVYLRNEKSVLCIELIEE